MHRPWCVSWPLVVAATLLLPVSAQQATDADVRAWLRLVADHRPGADDPPVLEASQWPWSELNPVLQALQQRASPVVILRSAAMLSDIAFFVPVGERPSANISGYSILAQDGQRRSIGMLDAHLAAGRRLLDALPRNASPDAAEVRAHVVAWYRTVSAALTSVYNLADLEPHVKRSLARFPDDPGILFDAGGFHEAYASPLTQVPLSEEAERDRPSQQMTGRQTTGTVMVLIKQSPNALLDEAQKLFRRATEQDPTLVEARVRLGRVLLARGRAAAAVPELERAVALEADETAKYYAWMFFGAALAETGKAVEAMRAFRSAAALFPYAPSPQLAISQVAAEQGNRTLAREALERVLAPDRRQDHFDPWWIYLRGNGRNYESVGEVFAARIHALPAIDLERWEGR
jgi:tetratricopeptide (TPR) repeat protein